MKTNKIETSKETLRINHKITKNLMDSTERINEFKSDMIFYYTDSINNLMILKESLLKVKTSYIVIEKSEVGSMVITPSGKTGFSGYITIIPNETYSHEDALLIAEKYSKIHKRDEYMCPVKSTVEVISCLDYIDLNIKDLTKKLEAIKYFTVNSLTF